MTELEKKQKAIIAHYGVDKQLDMLVEECAELIQAIQKYKRYKDIPGEGKAFDNLIEEIADVENIIDQIKLLKLYDPVMARVDIEEIKAKKVRRQLERIALEKLAEAGFKD